MQYYYFLASRQVIVWIFQFEYKDKMCWLSYSHLGKYQGVRCTTVIAIFSFLPKHPDLMNYKFCSSIAIAYLHFIELFFESQTKFWMAIGNQNASIWIHDSFATDFYGLLCRNINWYTVLAFLEMILYLPMEIRESKYILSESKENIRCVPTLKSTMEDKLVF